MRKRYAVFANGWANEYLRDVGNGLQRFGREKNVDFFFFVNFSVYADSDAENQGEVNIFRLPDIREFDGVILLTNSFNLQEEITYLHKKVLEAKVPAISVEVELDGLGFMGSDNYMGMYQLTEHLIREKKAKELLFIGGIHDHPESLERLRAVQDCAENCGIPLPKENILFGDWSGKSAEVCLEQWLEQHAKLPDAILCANDVMAAATCDWLMERGYFVPEDVMVTGYDNTNEAKEHKPPLTSVSKGWDDIGYRAALRLESIGNAKAAQCLPKEEGVASRMVLRESSGDEEKKEAKVRPVRKTGRVDGFETDRHFRHLYKVLRKCATPEECNQCLSQFFQEEGWMEGKDFMLCLHEGFFALDDPCLDMRKPGYSPMVNVICALKGGIPRLHQRLALRDAIFRASEYAEEPGLYLYVTIHSDEKHYGFAMLGRDMGIMEDKLLYIWTRHMSQYLQQIRSNAKIAELNRRLARLSEMDILTETYNRTGCQRVIYPFLESCQKNGGRGVVMFADIDHMKQINDRYGHGAGDQVLKLVATVLKRELPPGFMVGRFGGDEFYIAGESDGSLTVEDITAHILDSLKEEVRNRELPYQVTISIGGVILEMGESFQLDESLQQADEIMYRMKKQHHGQVNQS